MSFHKWDLVAIDPGKEAGIAYFEKGLLVNAELVNNALDHRDRERAAVLVVEIPVIYPHSPADPASLVKVAFSAGLLVGFFHVDELIKIDPHGWKGDRPKDVDNRYTMSKLGPVEVTIVNTSTSRGKLHNVIDAVGLGLWHLGRR